MSRRDLILGRFRHSAQERLQRLMLMMTERAARPDAGPEPLAELRRELHTLKGEARLLSLAALAALLHDTEERLRDDPDAAAAAAAAGLLEQALLELRAPAAPAAEEAAPEDRPSANQSEEERWARVSSRRIDELCGQVALCEAAAQGLRTSAAEVAGGTRHLHEPLSRLQGALADLSAAAWGLRLCPLGPLLADMAAYAQRLARAQRKHLHTLTSGGDVLVERAVLDRLSASLLHLVRNAVDHGVEPPEERPGKTPLATLELRAEAVGAHIVLTVGDDGRGVDPREVRAAATRRGLLSAEAAAALSPEQALDLLFVHGFSTRLMTSDLSGRGIGLDVVQATVEALGGSVALRSEVGQGSTFTLTLPANLTKGRVLCFPLPKDAEPLYGVPARSVLELVPLSDPRVRPGPDGAPRLHSTAEGEALVLRSLGRLLWGEVPARPAPPLPQDHWALVLDLSGLRAALTVPGPVTEHDLVRQPADQGLARLGYFAGSGVLADGRMVLHLWPAALKRLLSAAQPLLSRAPRRAPTAALGPMTSRAPAPLRRIEGRPRRALVVDDSVVIRSLLRQLLSGAGFLVDTAEDGSIALQRIFAGGLASSGPDIVVLDIDMPGADGFTVLAQIRARRPELPVVIFTGRGTIEDLQQAQALGASGYLVKTDFREETLLSLVCKLAMAS